MERIYYTTQVQEVSISKQEMIKLVIEDIAKRSNIERYDFNHSKPFVTETKDGGLKLRFVQGFMLQDGSPREISITPLEKYKEKL